MFHFLHRLFTGGSHALSPDPTNFTTCDLGLAAYLLYTGNMLYGYDFVDDGRLIFVFTGKHVWKHVRDYKSNKPIYFAPQAFLMDRAYLKRLNTLGRRSSRRRYPLQPPTKENEQ